VCPPVVEYDDGFQARAAEEVQALSEGSVIVEMLSDYAVMREQARACTADQGPRERAARAQEFHRDPRPEVLELLHQDPRCRHALIADECIPHLV